MALIECPACSKRMSSKAAACPHCNFNSVGVSNEQRQRELQQVLQRKRERLMSQSMLALLIAIAAFTYFFMQQPESGSWQLHLANGGMLVGLVWFVINRIRMLLLKVRS